MKRTKPSLVTVPEKQGLSAQDIAKITPKVRELSVYDGIPSLPGVSKFANRVVLAHPPKTLDTPILTDAYTPGKRRDTGLNIGKTQGEQLEDAKERTSARMAHAVKRLRQKNLLKPTVQSISELNYSDNPELACTIGLLGCILGGPESKGALWGHDGLDDLSDEEYEMAIELVMFLRERDTVYSKDLYGPLLEKHIAEIYTAVVLIHYARYQKDLIKEQSSALKKLDKISNKYGGFDEALEAVTTDIETIREQMQNELDENVKLVREAAQKDADAAESKLKALQKQIRPTEVKLSAAEARIDEQAQEIADLKQKLETLKSALESKNDQIADLISALPEDESELPELPDDILIVGGHTSVQARLKLKYPNWRYIKGTEKNFSDITQPACIFILPIDMLHSVQQRLMTMVSPDTPVIKIEGTNVDRIEHTMRKAYANIIPANT